MFIAAFIGLSQIQLRNLQLIFSQIILLNGMI
jgi:hypothetical protein